MRTLNFTEVSASSVNFNLFFLLSSNVVASRAEARAEETCCRLREALPTRSPSEASLEKQKVVLQ